jgi:hypothetical protein
MFIHLNELPVDSEQCVVRNGTRRRHWPWRRRCSPTLLLLDDEKKSTFCNSQKKTKRPTTDSNQPDTTVTAPVESSKSDRSPLLLLADRHGPVHASSHDNAIMPGTIVGIGVKVDCAVVTNRKRGKVDRAPTMAGMTFHPAPLHPFGTSSLVP